MKSEVSARGKITLPKEAREFLGIKAGDTVKMFMNRDGSLEILPTVSITVLRGIARGRAKGPVSIEDMEQSIMEQATERHLPRAAD